MRRNPGDWFDVQRVCGIQEHHGLTRAIGKDQRTAVFRRVDNLGAGFGVRVDAVIEGLENRIAVDPLEERTGLSRYSSAKPESNRQANPCQKLFAQNSHDIPCVNLWVRECARR